MELKLLIPLRNLLRNRRRTLLSLAIIALVTAMIYAVRGYVDESILNIRAGTVRQFGSFQIASPLLWAEKTENFQYLIPPEKVAQITEILRTVPEVTAYTDAAESIGAGDHRAQDQGRARHGSRTPKPSARL
jgi:hypothetical protein